MRLASLVASLVATLVAVPVDVLVEALEKARVGRLHILDQIVQERREKIKHTAPMVEVRVCLVGSVPSPRGRATVF